ncbi:MAG: hypothetical protein M1834_000964 [Cirrosporium novae-zelandiae]|nr:MAG: hypothetical protein M1834_000964 [Cirrosporium novae-zelandiae]
METRDSNSAIVDYSQWNTTDLVQRVLELEKQLKKQTQKFSSLTSPTVPRPPSPSPSPGSQARKTRKFDHSKYSTRLIALKFAYLGQRYNGFEHHNNNKTPLPSVEEELWKALVKAHLILPSAQDVVEGNINWDGCEYSKCGRTDRGVSAFGQVIGIRVRSNRLSPKAEVIEGESDVTDKTSMLCDNTAAETTPSDPPPFDPIKDELPYMQILNRLLPEDIRVLAWCPSPPLDFSARLSCKERRYRYFFTQPAFAPTPGPHGLNHNGKRDGWLDIEAMREGAKYFEGLHDFRNFCKIDPSKQITNFQRRIFHTSIEALDPRREPVGYVSRPEFRNTGDVDNIPHNPDHPSSLSSSSSSQPPQIYSFNLHGSAFLWHQVRHMIAILFLIGQGLESPSIIPHLLDISKNPAKPFYEMATDAPLVLWDCIFPSLEQGIDHPAESQPDSLEWVYVGDPRGKTSTSSTKSDGKFGYGGVADDVWRIWRRRKMDEILAGTLLDVVVGSGPRRWDLDQVRAGPPRSTLFFDGGNGSRATGKYVQLLQRKRGERVEVVNARYAAKKGLDVEQQQQQQSALEVQAATA